MHTYFYIAALGAAISVAGMMMTSCSSEEKAMHNETSVARKIESTTNTDSIRVYVDQAKAYAGNLIKEGKIDEAKTYISDLEPVVEKKAPAMTSMFAALKVDIAKAEAKAAARNAAEAVKETADTVASKTSEKAKEIGEKTSEKAKEIGEKTSDKAKEVGHKAADVFNKTKDKVAETAEKAADKTGDAVNKAADKTREALKK